jgi:hypothetical protein
MFVSVVPVVFLVRDPDTKKKKHLHFPNAPKKGKLQTFHSKLARRPHFQIKAKFQFQPNLNRKPKTGF